MSREPELHVVQDDRSAGLVKALVISVPEEAQGKGSSKALDDPWEGLGDEIVEPRYDIGKLLAIAEMSGEIQRAVEAMSTNIDGFGHRLVQRVKTDGDDTSDAIKRAVEREAIRLENFYAMAAMADNGRPIGFTQLRKKTRKDVEQCGNGYWEVVRNSVGEIIMFRHLRPQFIKLSKTDKTDTRIERRYLTRDEDGNWTYKTRVEFHRLRRFVQSFGDLGVTQTRWFKSFGDPRVLDNRTGEYVPLRAEVAEGHTGPTVEDFDGQGRPMPEHRKASEIIHFSIYSPLTPYGVPRWIGELLTTLGIRGADEVNYFTLDNNNVPSMVVTISNGRLTPGSIDRIKEYVATHIRGKQNYSTFLILEGESGFVEGDEASTPKINITPLHNTQMHDALFSNYTSEGNVKIRRCWRFGGVFTGELKDVNKSNCHSDDTETLTRRGWLRYDQVLETDEIATLNPETNAIEYHRPIGKHVQWYSGPMVHVYGHTTDALVTLNHDVWMSDDGLSFQKIRAVELVERRQHFRLQTVIVEDGTVGVVSSDDGVAEPVDDYHGVVYCFQVPNGLFVTRRNGKVAIHGNSEVSRRLGDEQVFAPERDDFDWFINHVIQADLGILYHRYASKTPNVTDNQMLAQILASAERTGGVTPRLARKIIEDIFPDAKDLPPLDPQKVDPDVPFSLTMAEAVKNMAQPTEIGQQVAPVQPAIKSAITQEMVRELLGFGEALTAEIAKLYDVDDAQ